MQRKSNHLSLSIVNASHAGHVFFIMTAECDQKSKHSFN